MQTWNVCEQLGSCVNRRSEPHHGAACGRSRTALCISKGMGVVQGWLAGHVSATALKHRGSIWQPAHPGFAFVIMSSAKHALACFDGHMLSSTLPGMHPPARHQGGHDSLAGDSWVTFLQKMQT